jgi:chitin disaccharide deacetylase
MTSGIILCADDFAMTEGISTGIADLAAERRLSAASAMVTGAHWPGHAGRLRDLSEAIAIGLHFNLTLGRPLGAMPWLCPTGAFPAVSAVVRASLARHIQPGEIAAELNRQLDAFENGAGMPPDFIDGHQHVHGLPVVRVAVLDVLKQRYGGRALLVRDPGDSPATILGRGGAVKKALLLATLARGFGDAVRAAGFIANSSFAGVSAFDETKSYRAELDRFFKRPSDCHLVMCHPGHVDDELRLLDPVVGRRAQELSALTSFEGLPARLWHPQRSADGNVVWPGREAVNG